MQTTRNTMPTMPMMITPPILVVGTGTRAPRARIFDSMAAGPLHRRGRARPRAGSTDRSEEGGMTIKQVAPLPASYTETTRALHRLAVYVISPAQRLANGEIILRATPGGFSTFAFDGHVVGVDGDQLVVDGTAQPDHLAERGRGGRRDRPRRRPSRSSSTCLPHGDLDRAAGRSIAACGARARRLVLPSPPRRSTRCGRKPRPGRSTSSIVRIWPEHFDAAIDMGDDDCRIAAAPTARRPATAHHPRALPVRVAVGGPDRRLLRRAHVQGRVLAARRGAAGGARPGRRRRCGFLREARDRIRRRV